MQTAGYAYGQFAEKARARKTEALYAALVRVCKGACPDPDVIRTLDDAGWKALEKLAGTRPASALTRAALVERVILRHEVEARFGEDPYEGLTG